MTPALRLPIGLAAFSLVALTLRADRPARADEPVVEFHAAVEFGRAGGLPLLLDLARPRAEGGRRPAILVLHGGGWTAGSRTDHGDLVRILAARGFVAATADYRLAPTHPWPAQIEDAKCAVRYLRANADRWGIDRSKIGAVGFSAGAHLAMLLGTMEPEDGLEGNGGSPEASSRVVAVVSWFGPTDLDGADLPEPGKRLLDALLGPAFRADRGAASPVRYLDAGDAPMLLLQGSRDRLVPRTQALAMLEALDRVGVPSEVRFHVPHGHGWGPPLLADSLEDTIRFLERRLLGRRPAMPRPP
jgi:acetyl esterase/lipase